MRVPREDQTTPRRANDILEFFFSPAERESLVRWSELGGASSVREKAFTGLVWTRISVSTGCSPAVGLVKHRHPFDGGSSVERLARSLVQATAAEAIMGRRGGNAIVGHPV